MLDPQVKALAETRTQQEEEERKKREEAKVRHRLWQMGVFRRLSLDQLVKQSGGRRCADGSHFVSDAELGV